MRFRLLISGLAVVGLSVGIGAVALPNGFINATTTQSFDQQKQTFLQQQANKANNNTNVPVDHPIGSVGPTTSAAPASPWELQGLAPYPGVAAAISQTTAWMWGRYPGSSVQDLQSQVLVVSGSEPNNTTEGEIGVWVFNMGPVSWQGQFAAPGQTGSISIESFQGEVATWTSTSGEQGTFNIATHVWSMNNS